MNIWLKVGGVSLIFGMLFVQVERPMVARAQGMHPERDRISDEVIAEDLRTIDALESRLIALNASGVPVGSYHLSKAQAWIDFARYEYTENDRTGIIEAALAQAGHLVKGLEEKTVSLSMETPIVSGSQMIRQDLWGRVAEMKAHKDFHCAEGVVAELEVRLVHSGHEMEEMGWRHAKPHIQKAEELAESAQAKLDACPQPVVVAPLPPPPPPAISPVVVAIQKMQKLANEVHFALDEATIHSKTAKVLDGIAIILQDYPVIKLHLKGRADHRGGEDYNLDLSQRRAEAIVGYLQKNGVAADRMTTEAEGKRYAPETDTRVEDFAKSRQGKFLFYDASGFEQAPQFDDLQIEPRKAPQPPAVVVPAEAPKRAEPPPAVPRRSPPPLTDELQQNIILQPSVD
jgi:outer membrane protein OmpA-like peptidoglycan-associated protein